jgi:DsbC/DsbD-like thiol-disulfide interchange protein
MFEAQLFRKRVFILLVSFIFFLPYLTSGAFAQSNKTGSTVDMLDAGTLPVGLRLVGVEIHLDPGYKTYWREPGDSGLPPVFDWQGSENVASVDVRWPVPVRFADGSGSSIGYKDSVILPVLVTLRDTAQRARLKLKIDYGICAELCVPALGEAELSLLPNAAATPHREQVEAALGRVPQSAQLGDGLLPGIIGVEPDEKQTALRVKVARLAGSREPDLFVEGPKGWYFGQPVLSGATDGAELDWLVPVEQKPEDGTLAGLALTLTAVAGAKATETSIRLDEQGRAR